jgi:predicted CXXCH cytochrome family protein
MTGKAFLKPSKLIVLSIGIVGSLAALALVSWPALSAGTETAPLPQTEREDGQDCLACHSNPALRITLPSGEELSLYVDPQGYAASVHGQHGTSGYQCIRCHTDIAGYPHPDLTAATRRELTLQQYSACARCHTDASDDTMTGAHQVALENGDTRAAVCSDCHTAHDVQRLTDVRTGALLPEARPLIPAMCRQCHSQIYDLYASSVHGQALLEEGNTDVPTCVDCHQAHMTQGPSVAGFREASPQVCATCHANAEMMAGYGINPGVYTTYVTDFHGETVVLTREATPEEGTSKPVCVDCHGVHNILAADDPQSTVSAANLLGTCQRCHPQAGFRFPASWLNHQVPSPRYAPLVYYVNLFYKIFIPAVIGVMALFVITDAIRRILNRRRERGDV